MSREGVAFFTGFSLTFFLTVINTTIQRIQEDVASFTGFSLSFFLTVINTTIDLIRYEFKHIVFSCVSNRR